MSASTSSSPPKIDSSKLDEIWEYNEHAYNAPPPPPPPISRGPSTHLIQVRHLMKPKEHERDGPTDDHPYHTGRLWRARSFVFEYAGEFFGTMMLVMFGTGANCQYNLSHLSEIASTPAGTWASVSLGWGTGIALGILLSGGHINPAVTLAMAVWRGFPWRKVPGYFFCQLMGALCGALIVYGNYKTAISIQEGGNHIRTLSTAGYFGTIPLDYMTNIGCFFDEFIGTALLLFGVLSLLDPRNSLTPGLVAVGIFIVFVGIAACFGMQTGD
ncbi:putative membrane protein [Psilocybe cubensis]|uniref:Membrane protein n=1 Tax=Psilocybe cubensis TaxID=181762 RepID=A0ACB8GVZ9_PSICU|nr:putative membrane protein [Psilocybe cubensis]KAH9479813.1 putative membrane protein [Psilocybe cubensis]